MISDLLAVAWKEYKDFISQRGSLFGMLFFVVIFGVFLPAQTGAGWVENPAGMFNLVVVPVFLVLNVIADAFAGERERHTLETLLASRLSDSSILFGKILTAAAYGWSLTLAGLALGLLTVNLKAMGGGLLLYPARLFAGVTLFSLLGVSFVAVVGVLVSLRSATVRQAQQTLSIGIMGLVAVTLIGLAAMPAGVRDVLRDVVRDAGAVRLALITGLGLAAADVAVLLVVIARFRRSRLIAG